MSENSAVDQDVYIGVWDGRCVVGWICKIDQS